MEQKKYYTYEEAAEYLGVGRSTLYALAKELGVQTKKFKGNKRRYLALADVKRMKTQRDMVVEQPWIAEEKPDGEVA